MTGRFDNTAAACLSLVLVACAFVFLFGERWFRQRSRFTKHRPVSKTRAATLSSPHGPAVYRLSGSRVRGRIRFAGAPADSMDRSGTVGQ